MNVQPTFDGSESAADIARAAIEWFAAQQPHDADFTIFYENSIPKMKYELEAGWVEFVCVYRLDKMLESFYADAVRIFDENVKARIIEEALREMLVPYIAFSGMTSILSRLLILQSQIFLDMLDEVRVTASGMFLHSIVAQRGDNPSPSRAASKVIQSWIDECVATSMKKKRDFLVGYMNTQRLINIPTSVGRPAGTTKPEEKKREEAARFAERVETTIRQLYTANGQIPTKTAVAKALNIGSVTKEGNNTRLTVFGKKLKRLKIDYDAIVERVKLDK
jgi:hypothetical protein